SSSATDKFFRFLMVIEKDGGSFRLLPSFSITMRNRKILSVALLLLVAVNCALGQDLNLNKLEYFETQGVNVLVYNNLFNGGFNDEKNAGIELIHHGVRTAQGGAVRLSNTPEQWDLVPT
ncbi:hypothetical protein, partial [Clavibacter michiganensis]|uniref:hypothetical protein n=1 Tax=Clavibacter michiganensis TaxID=28447 RepID=UPI00292FB2FD